MYPPETSAAELAAKPVRAAIYTRVSTDESLGMEFNSLDAQLEACAAYVTSQRHEGWQLVATRYDDGGYSGGSMKRPALERLLDDVSAGLIDVVVVYKIDRLTRSLADFSRIVDVLDAHKASFISITQAFSTTTSMGRLTLNVLLSFAQFEREVGAERVRDKIDSSKKKGMWMGGVVPLGYDVINRKLVVNECEAETVRLIFESYIALRSVTVLEPDLARRGVVSKRTIGKSGVARGGEPFTRGALYNLLQNVIYIGKIAHRGQTYAGQHAAILEPELFEETQAILAQNRVDRRQGRGAIEPSLLTGLLFDERGNRLTPSHTSRGPRRFRYYVGAKPTDARKRQLRVPAGELERAVIAKLSEWLLNPHAVEAAFRGAAPDAVTLEAVLLTAATCAAELRQSSPAKVREMSLDLVVKIIVAGDHLTILLNPSALLARAGSAIARTVAPLAIECSFALLRRSKEVRLMVAPTGAVSTGQSDPALIKLLVKAHSARQALLASDGRSVAELSKAEGYHPHYFAGLVKLSYLAPDITEAILSGQHPARLNRQQLARMRQWPIEWVEQRELVAGFAGV